MNFRMLGIPLDDLYEFDPATLIWTELGSDLVQGKGPSPRSSFGFTAIRDCIYFFGGINFEGTTSHVLNH